MYPLQNQCASKLATHGFASKSDTRHSKKHLRKQVLFATMCSARAERDAPFGRDVDFVSDVRFAREPGRLFFAEYVRDFLSALCACCRHKHERSGGS